MFDKEILRSPIYDYKGKIEFISYYNVDYETFVYLSIDKLKNYYETITKHKIF